MNFASVLAFLAALFKALPILDKWYTKISVTLKNAKNKRRESKVIKANAKKGKKYEDAITVNDAADAFDELP